MRQVDTSSSGGVSNGASRVSVGTGVTGRMTGGNWRRLGPTRSRRLALVDSTRPASDAFGGRLDALFSRRETPRLEVKVLARYLSEDAEPGYRPELVAQAKARIAQGGYDTNDRIEAALERMMRDLA
jgi:hypothetical protein